MGRHALDRIAVGYWLPLTCIIVFLKSELHRNLFFCLCFHYYDSGCLSSGRQLAVKTALCLSWKVSRVGEFSLSRGNHGKIGQREQRLTQRISKHIVKMGVVKVRQVFDCCDVICMVMFLVSPAAKRSGYNRRLVCYLFLCVLSQATATFTDKSVSPACTLAHTV